MMQPVSRFKGQPVTMVTSAPWLSVSGDPAPRWLWLASWSASAYQATPPLVFYPPAVWIPEHTHLLQWEHPALDVVPMLPTLYRFSPPRSRGPPPEFAKGWISAEETGLFPRGDEILLLANRIIQKPAGHTLRRHLLRSSSRLSGGAHCDLARLPIQRQKEAWPLILPNQQQREALQQPVINHRRRPSPPTQCPFGPLYPSKLCIERWMVSPLQFSSRLTLVTDYRRKRRDVGQVSYGGALLLRTKRTSTNRECVGVSVDRTKEDKKDDEGRKDQRPVACTPVPGSPWCVVWTGDDRMFFFNPTIHLSVWERPGELIGHDISNIVQNPPHKRKKMPPTGSDVICQSPGLRGDDHEEEDDHKRSSKRNRTEDSMSLVPHPREVKLLPLDLRVGHFREMMLERGVSAFSTWEKELHKMVFDPRYLLLTANQRKQVFDQFVKSRVKDEYKEKKSKLHKAREEFRQLLEEANVTSRSTFKEFCSRHHGDQRFNTLNSKKEQEVLFNNYITALKKRDKENRARLRKMR